MAWADATAYSEAVQNPRLAFLQPDLQEGILKRWWKDASGWSEENERLGLYDMHGNA